MVADQLSGGGGAEGASSEKRGSVVCLMGAMGWVSGLQVVNGLDWLKAICGGRLATEAV